MLFRKTIYMSLHRKQRSLRCNACANNKITLAGYLIHVRTQLWSVEAVTKITIRGYYHLRDCLLPRVFNEFNGTYIKVQLWNKVPRPWVNKTIIMQIILISSIVQCMWKYNFELKYFHIILTRLSKKRR